jgi:hypothetical protein
MGGPGWRRQKRSTLFGRYDAIGFSPFGVDRTRGQPIPSSAGVYGLPLATGAPDCWNTRATAPCPPSCCVRTTRLRSPGGELHAGGHARETPRRVWNNATRRQTAPSVALFIATGPDEYFVVGSGVKATFSSNTPGTPLAGLGTVEEGTFVNGRWVPGRLLAGDDTEQGDYLFLRNMGILRVTVYRYR